MLNNFVYHKYMKRFFTCFLLMNLVGCDGVYINRFKISEPRVEARKDASVSVASYRWYAGDQWINSYSLNDSETKFIGMQSVNRDVVTVTVSELQIDGAFVQHSKSKFIQGTYFNCTSNETVTCISVGSTPSIVVQCFGQLDTESALISACTDIIETSLEH